MNEVNPNYRDDLLTEIVEHAEVDIDLLSTLKEYTIPATTHNLVTCVDYDAAANFAVLSRFPGVYPKIECKYQRQTLAFTAKTLDKRMSNQQLWDFLSLLDKLKDVICLDEIEKEYLKNLDEELADSLF